MLLTSRWLSCLHHRHGLGCGHNRDALEAFEDQQVHAIPRHDPICLGRLQREYRIIVRAGPRGREAIDLAREEA